MVSTKKSIGNVALAGIFAAATLAAAVPAFASTTITWNFNNPSGALTTTKTDKRGRQHTVPLTSYTYAGNVTGGSLPSDVSGPATITASGYQMGAQSNMGTPTGLYGKGGSGPGSSPTEQGLGLAHGVDHEISIYGSSGTQYFIQLDLTPFLTQPFFQTQNATLTIGSLQSPDTAELWVSGKAGQLGTELRAGGLVPSGTGSNNGSNQTTTIALSDFSAADPYLTVSAQVVEKQDQNSNWYWCGSQYTTESVLLDNMTINIPGGTGGGSPAPVPATAGLTLAGALGMGLMVFARRRRNAL